MEGHFHQVSFGLVSKKASPLVTQRRRTAIDNVHYLRYKLGQFT